MGRYNIPKADSKELINEVQNSSSGDGGVKRYYYKVLDNKFMEVIIFVVCFDNLMFQSETNEVFDFPSYVISNYNIANLLAFTYKDVPIMTVHVYSNALVTIPKGDLYERISYYYTLIGKEQSEIEGHIQKIKQCVIPITKEEYESMITYKP